MVNKMVEEKLVVHKPYSGVQLTAKGTKYAEELVRKHRIWETFLINTLHFDLPDVHDEAELLEHVTSDKMIDHLDDFWVTPSAAHMVALFLIGMGIMRRTMIKF